MFLGPFIDSVNHVEVFSFAPLSGKSKEGANLIGCVSRSLRSRDLSQRVGKREFAQDPIERGEPIYCFAESTAGRSESSGRNSSFRAVFGGAWVSEEMRAAGSEYEESVRREGHEVGRPRERPVAALRPHPHVYRPERGCLWQHPPYFHDGSAATLADVVAHYDRVRKLGLTADQQRELVEYLKSL